MNKLIKVVAALFTLVIVAVAALLLLVNPNHYKGQLQTLAREQGIDLKLQGDLSWQFWPNLGIQVSQVSASPLLPAQLSNKMAVKPLATIDQLSASVQVMPLFSGSIAVDGISIDKAHFNLVVDKNGRGNWELPSKAEQAALANAHSQANSGQANSGQASNTAANSNGAAGSQATSNTETHAETNAEPGKLNLAINSIELKQISAEFNDQSQDLTLALQQLNLSINNFNLEEKPFSVALNFRTALDNSASKLQLQTSGDLSTNMTLSSDFSRYTFNNTRLNTDINGMAAGQNIEQLNFNASDVNLNDNAFPLELSWAVQLAEPNARSTGKLNSQLRIPADMALIQLMDATLASELTSVSNEKSSKKQSQQQLSFNANIKDPKGEPTINGTIALQEFNLKQLLESIGQTAPATSEPKALTRISLSANYDTDLNNLTLSQLALKVDDTQINGQAQVLEFDSKTALPKVIAKLSGDKINVDHYLAPEVAEVAEVVKATEKTTAAPAAKSAGSANSQAASTTVATTAKAKPVIVIPVDDIQPLRLDIGVNFNDMILKKMRFEQAKLQINANQGLLQLKQLDANFYKGSIAISADLDARTGTANKATVKSSGQFSGIELGPLLKDLQLDEEYQVAGTLGASFSGSSAGVTDTQLMKLLDAKVDMNSPQITVQPINIEQQYCALVQATKQEANKAEWPKQSVISNFKGGATIKNENMNIPAISGEIVNLKVGAYGDVNLDSGQYEILFPITLTQAWTSEEGCRTKEKFLIGRKLEWFRAKGNLDDSNPTKNIGANPAGLADFSAALFQHTLSKKLGLTPKNDSADGGDAKPAEKIDTRDVIRGLFDSYLPKQAEKNKEGK